MRQVNACPACDSREFVVKAQLSEHNRGRFLDYDSRKYGGLLQTWLGEVTPVIAQCRRCGHGWYLNQPSDQQLISMYDAGRPLIASSAQHGAATPRMLAEMQRLFALARSRHANGRLSLLDYGSGFGAWARAAATVGFDVVAFEPSLSRGNRQETPFRVVSSLEELGDARFTVVQLEQVLEHVSEPLATLQIIRRYCVPNGVLRVTVPNLLRADEGAALWDEWPFNGSRPHTMAPFEHLQGFTPRSLGVLVQRAGFQIARDLNVWRLYPQNSLRLHLGNVVPSLGTTAMILGAPAASRPHER